MSAELLMHNRIVIDTGPLLLYLVGFIRIKELKQFNYNERDFILLNIYLKNIKNICVTPQVLAEISNLAKRRLGSKTFSSFIISCCRSLEVIGEEYIHKDEIINSHSISILGITDTSLILASKRGNLILTDDGPFFYYCIQNNIPAISLDTLRTLMPMV